jgi:hypothetical protein
MLWKFNFGPKNYGDIGNILGTIIGILWEHGWWGTPKSPQKIEPTPYHKRKKKKIGLFHSIFFTLCSGALFLGTPDSVGVTLHERALGSYYVSSGNTKIDRLRSFQKR